MRQNLVQGKKGACFFIYAVNYFHAEFEYFRYLRQIKILYKLISNSHKTLHFPKLTINYYLPSSILQKMEYLSPGRAERLRGFKRSCNPKWPDITSNGKSLSLKSSSGKQMKGCSSSGSCWNRKTQR